MPSDFHLFRYLKEFLGGKHFATDDEMKEAVQNCLSSQAADVYDLGIQKLIEHYDKCLNRYGNYTDRETCKEFKKLSYLKKICNILCFISKRTLVSE